MTAWKGTNSPKSLDVLAQPFDTVTVSVHGSRELGIQYLHQPDIGKTGIDRRSACSRVAPNTQTIARGKVSRCSCPMAQCMIYLKVTTMCVCVLCTQWSGTWYGAWPPPSWKPPPQTRSVSSMEKKNMPATQRLQLTPNNNRHLLLMSLSPPTSNRLPRSPDVEIQAILSLRIGVLELRYDFPEDSWTRPAVLHADGFV